MVSILYNVSKGSKSPNILRMLYVHAPNEKGRKRKDREGRRGAQRGGEQRPFWERKMGEFNGNNNLRNVPPAPPPLIQEGGNFKAGHILMDNKLPSPGPLPNPSVVAVRSGSSPLFFAITNEGQKLFL